MSPTRISVKKWATWRHLHLKAIPRRFIDPFIFGLFLRLNSFQKISRDPKNSVKPSPIKHQYPVQHRDVKEEIICLTREDLAKWLKQSLATIDSLIEDGLFPVEPVEGTQFIRIPRHQAIASIMAFRRPGILG